MCIDALAELTQLEVVQLRWAYQMTTEQAISILQRKDQLRVLEFKNSCFDHTILPALLERSETLTHVKLR